MKNFSKYTYDSYLRKTRDIMRNSIEIFERRKKIVRFVRAGKENKERYTILPKQSLEMLREYFVLCYLLILFQKIHKNVVFFKKIIYNSNIKNKRKEKGDVSQNGQKCPNRNVPKWTLARPQ